jgi:demethylmenaquinone methyltransferase/2-methoxy-6-polyprenyl-1,4-benzoquinol methylase
LREYYHRRAPEYDDWYAGKPYSDPDQRAGFLAERERLEAALRDLTPARTLDVACGTGYLTQHLPGEVVGLDQSSAMLEIARDQAPNATYVPGDAFALPFPAGSFERVFTGHFYGHLEPPDRAAFLTEARRVSPEIVVADAARRPGHEPDEWQQRAISDGTTYPVFKRFFLPEQLVDELGGGGEIVFAGDWFVAVRA